MFMHGQITTENTESTEGFRLRLLLFISVLSVFSVVSSFGAEMFPFSSRLPKYVTGFRVLHKTGDFLPYIANDVGIFESEKRHIVVCVFTANHYGIGAQLEDAIARIGELIANEFAVDR